MQRIEVSVLGFTIAVDAPLPVAQDLIDALACRAVIDAHCGPPVLVYELRSATAPSLPCRYEVVRLNGRSCERIDWAVGVDEAADLIANDLHRWVADHHRHLLAVHAGSVEWNGVGIIIPGRSRSGKSSLVASLLRHGACYMSDEFALIDSEARVHPYPRALSMRDTEGKTRLVSPSEFGASSASQPAPLAVIVDTAYVAGEHFAPSPVRGAAGLLAVIDNCLVARSRPVHTMKIAAALVPEVVVLRSPRGDATQAARVILEATTAARSVPS